MADASAAPMAPIISDMMEKAITLARNLYGLLVRALRGLQRCAWCGTEQQTRSLEAPKKTHEPARHARRTSMLCGLLIPQWVEGEERGLRGLLKHWERDVAVRGRQGRAKLSEDIKTTGVMRHAPRDIKTAIRMTMPMIERFI